MKRKYCCTFILFCLSFSVSLFAQETKEKSLQPLSFEETWGFASMSRASEYNDEVPVTDVCYFTADVNCYGELIDIPKIEKLPVTNKRRHMVFMCDSKSLTHFVLSPEYDVRQNIIEQLKEAVKPFDGLCIDLELIPARDGPLFLSFITEIRSSLPDKILSVCVPARFKLGANDLYPYARIAEVCDRVIIMAYDQHWAGGTPGPVADWPWCKKVTNYAKKAIPAEKIIMGLPFYGRSWADKSTDGAWYFSSAQKKMTENHVETYTYDDHIPFFQYTTEVTVKGWFNDATSIHYLAENYQKMGIKKIGFWRLGMEDPEVWNLIKAGK